MEWCFGWKRSLRPNDLVEFRNLQRILQQASLTQLDKDYLIWSPNKHGLLHRGFPLSLNLQNLNVNVQTSPSMDSGEDLFSFVLNICLAYASKQIEYRRKPHSSWYYSDI